MADISLLSRLINGIQRNVDISANTLVMSSLKLGTSELTKTQLDLLVLTTDSATAVDASAQHHHDGRYFTETELGATTNGSAGASLIGVDQTPAFSNISGATVQAIIESIDTALNTAGGSTFSDADFAIQNDATPTKQIAFDASGISASTTRTITMPDANVDLGALANTALSNLATTSINQDLLPSGNNTRKLGSASLKFSELHSYHASLATTSLVTSSWGSDVPALVFDGSTTEAQAAYGAGLVYDGDYNEGGLLLLTKDVSSANGSAAVFINTGYNSGAGNTGEIAIYSGSASGASGNSGIINLTTGPSTNGDSGNITLVTGAANNGTRGKVVVNATELDMSSSKITNLAAPTNNNDAARKTDVDAKVSKTGDTMSGNLAMGGNKVTGLAAPTVNGDALRFDQLGSNNGIATLDGSGKVPVSQLPSAVMTYEGTFDASDTPASPLLDGDGAADAGMVYIASVAGTYDFGSGGIAFNIGDWAIYNGATWEHSSTSNAVVSVNSQTGVVVLDTDDITEGTNKYFSDELAQDAIGAMVQNTTKITLEYQDGVPSLTADINAGTLENSDISASAAIDYSKLNLNASIVNDDVAAGAGIVYSKLNLNNAIVAGDLQTDSVTTDKITDANVTTAKIADANVTEDKIADDAVTTNKLIDDAVTSAKIGSNQVDETHISTTAVGSGLDGGGGVALSVVSSPSVKKTMVAGEAFAANTSFAVRIALTGETAGRVYKADFDASASDKFYAYGMVEGLGASAKVAGDPVVVVLMGTVDLGSSDTNFAAGEVGQAVHLKAAGAFDAVSQITYSTDEASYRVGMVQEVGKILVGNMQLLGIN